MAASRRSLWKYAKRLAERRQNATSLVVVVQDTTEFGFRWATGTVKLLTLGQPNWLPTAAIKRQSRRRGNPADSSPRFERTRPCGSMFTGGDVVAAEMEEVVDLVVGGEKMLGLPR